MWDPPGPPKEPKIMAQYPKIESIESIGSIILGIFEVQATTGLRVHVGFGLPQERTEVV